MSVLPLTTFERLRAYAELKQEQRAEAAALLDAMIDSVSQKMEQYCSRVFLIHEVVEAGTLTCDEFPCFQVPVQSISRVSYSSTGRRADLVALPSSQYEISASGNNIKIYDVAYGGLVECTFTGGLAENTADVIANHPALEDACKMQVTALWQRHSTPDRTGTTLGTGETNWTADYQLLKSVKSDLDQQYNNRHRIL